MPVVAHSLLAVLGPGRFALVLEWSGCHEPMAELFGDCCTIETSSVGQLAVHRIAKRRGPTAPPGSATSPMADRPALWVDVALGADERLRWEQLQCRLDGDACCESNDVWVRSVVSIGFEESWLYKALATMLVDATGPNSWLLRRPAYVTTAQYYSCPPNQTFI